MEKEFTFESAMARLEEITTTLQSNNCTLDQSIALFEEGLKLANLCKEKLSGFEAKLNEITKDNKDDQ